MAEVLSVRCLIPRLGTRKLHYLLSKEFIDDRIKVGRDGLFDLLGEDGLIIKKNRRYIMIADSKYWMRR
jgi:putative transposase